MKECSYAKKYKAIRPPKCNGGNPCDACKVKWAEKEWNRLTLMALNGYFE